METKKENKLLTLLKNTLKKINKHFDKVDKIDRILVSVKRNKQWIKNPKKIRYWLNAAKGQTTFGINNKLAPCIEIKKIIYKEKNENTSRN